MDIEPLRRFRFKTYADERPMLGVGYDVIVAAITEAKKTNRVLNQNNVSRIIPQKTIPYRRIRDRAIELNLPLTSWDDVATVLFTYT